MKPYLLKMQAFGPYNKYTECDFSLLYDSKIFLISGKTGSGKTAVLDAMCFALYGESTGAARRLTDMRSSSAQDSLPTLLEFEFLLGERKYKFERELRVRHKRNGDTDEVQTAACSEWLDGRWRLIASGSAAVTAEAKNILSFSSEQFSQVVVLPQGEFKRLLVASGREKTEILQVLFSASKWQEIQRRLSFRERTLAGELKELNVGLSTLYQAAEAAGQDDLEQKLAEAGKSAEEAGKFANEQNNLLELAYKKHEEAAALAAKFLEFEGAEKQAAQDESDKAGLKIQEDNINLLRKMLNINPLYQQQKNDYLYKLQGERDYKAAADGLEAARKILDEAKEAAAAIPSLTEKEREYSALAARMEDALPAVESLEEKQKSALEAGEKIKRLTENIKSVTEEIEGIDARLAKGDEYLSKGQKRLFDDYPKWLERRTKLKETLENHRLLEEGLKLSGEQSALEAAEKSAYDKLNGEFEAAAQKLKSARERMNENMAFLLSQGLSPGAECPVCGSTNHPAPALPAEGALSPGELNALEEEYNNIAGQREGAAAAAAAAAAKSTEAAERLAGLQALLKDEASPEELDTELEQVTAGIAETEKFRANLEKYKETLTELRLQRAQKSAEAESFRKDLSELQSALAGLNAEIAQGRERAGNITPAEFREKLNQTKKSAAGLSEQLEDINKRLNTGNIAYSAAVEREKSSHQNTLRAEENHQKSRAAFEAAYKAAGIPENSDFESFNLTGEELDKLYDEYTQKLRQIEDNARRLGELRDFLKDKERPDIAKTAEELEQYRNKAAGASEKFGSLSNILKTLQNTAAETSRLIAENTRIHEKYQKVKRIAELISGGSGNPKKINIESFVLGLMLDEVVSAATRYLLRLSRGRYTLVRADGSDRRMRSGLEIEVTDTHLGAQRRISTLSGGELFLASLSLAFGLSEVVQGYAGGVRLDSIFIDEGFGSLDQETLDCAMRALDEIRSEGRLVGVISHVAELKERIFSRIEVEDGGLTVISQ